MQRVLIEAICLAMTDHLVILGDYRPLTAHEYAEALRRRNLQFRTRGVQIMVLCALVLRPLPPEVAARVERFARALGVEEGMVGVARRFAEGTLGLAAVDFERNGYTADWGRDDRDELHTSRSLAKAWDLSVDDPVLAARWGRAGVVARGDAGPACPQLYGARGFGFPGSPGSAPPLLAQHDWVHVLGDYGTTVESELEVFALIARANDDLRAFSLLAMVVSLFETGYLRTGAGLFEYDVGHLSGASRRARLAARIADGMSRGVVPRQRDRRRQRRLPARRLVHPGRPAGGRGARAVLPAPEVGGGAPCRVRRAVGAGRISPFQLRAGRAAAEREDRPYDSFGAEPARPARRWSSVTSAGRRHVRGGCQPPPAPPPPLVVPELAGLAVAVPIEVRAVAGVAPAQGQRTRQPRLEAVAVAHLVGGGAATAARWAAARSAARSSPSWAARWWWSGAPWWSWWGRWSWWRPWSTWWGRSRC